MACRAKLRDDKRIFLGQSCTRAIVLARGHVAIVIAQAGLQVVLIGCPSLFKLYEITGIGLCIRAIGRGGRDTKRIACTLYDKGRGCAIVEDVPLSCLKCGCIATEVDNLSCQLLCLSKCRHNAEHGEKRCKKELYLFLHSMYSFSYKYVFGDKDTKKK